jgi:glycosyltransferase involved in cell wall biosynthesis
MTTFSVCLPATRPGSVGAAIRSIQAQTFSDWELIVVGQGEDRELRAAVAASWWDDRVRYLRIARRGSSRARTAALKAARGEIVAMTDDDCEARPDWLAVMKGVLDEEPDTALVGGSMIAPARRAVWPASCPAWVPAEALYDPRASGRHAPAGWDWIGANFAIRRSAAALVGDFDACLGIGGDFPAAGDTDYKLRMEAHGLTMRSTPRAVVYHTSGWRYGVRDVLQHQRNHARGNGALAAKLTLMGDPRGRQWLETTWRDCRPLKRPPRLLANLRVLHHFSAGYRDCLRGYEVDQLGLLSPLIQLTEASFGEPAMARVG